MALRTKNKTPLQNLKEQTTKKSNEDNIKKLTQEGQKNISKENLTQKDQRNISKENILDQLSDKESDYESNEESEDEKVVTLEKYRKEIRSLKRKLEKDREESTKQIESRDNKLKNVNIERHRRNIQILLKCQIAKFDGLDNIDSIFRHYMAQIGEFALQKMTFTPIKL